MTLLERLEKLATIYPRVGLMTQWWVRWKYTITIESTGKYDAAGDEYPRFQLKRYKGSPKCRGPNDDWGRVGFSIRILGFHLEISSLQPFRVRTVVGRIARWWLERRKV